MRGIILCAGLGERLRPITDKTAKPAVRFLNIPILAYPLFWLETLGLKELVINTHYQPATVEAAVRSVVDMDYGLTFLHEEKILGTGGAIWNARDHLSGDDVFAYAAGDPVALMLDGKAMRNMLEFHRRNKPLATLMVCDLPGIGTEVPGVWFDSGQNVVRFGKGSDPHLTCQHFVSLALLSDEIFSLLPNGPSNLLYDVLTPAIAQGRRVTVWKEEMKWFETGRPRDYLFASQFCLQLLAKGEAARWHLIDIMDRFNPGWRNYDGGRIFAKEPPTFSFQLEENSVVLLGDQVHSSTAVHFEGLSVLGANLDLSGRTSTEGVFLSDQQMWVR